MAMTFNQLRAFTTLADIGSVGSAAQRLHVTQPAVSASVRGLEAALGAKLIEPDGRGVRLTADGAAFATYARRMLGLAEEATLTVRGGDDPGRGTLRIAAVTTASEQVLPGHLAAFLHAFPATQVVLEVGSKEQVWTWIADHVVDVVLAGRPPTSQAQLTVRARRDNEQVIVAAPDLAASVPAPIPGAPTTHPRSGDAVAGLPLTALEGHTWLLREAGSGTRETLEALLTAAEMTPPMFTLGSNGAVVAGAVAGLGVTLVSRDAVGRELASGELVIVETAATPLARPWHLVTRMPAPPTTELFVRHLLDRSAHDPPPRFAPPTPRR